MNDVVVVDFLRGQFFAEFKPDLVQEINLFGRQAWRMRSQVGNVLVPGGCVNFNNERRLWGWKPFPGGTRQASLLNSAHLGGKPQDDGRRLQGLSRAQNAIPYLRGRDNSQVDCLSVLFRDIQGTRKKLLLMNGEELIGEEIVFPGAAPHQDPDVKHHDVLARRIYAPQHGGKMIERVIVADGNEDVPGPHVQGFRPESFCSDQIKLVKALSAVT